MVGLKVKRLPLHPKVLGSSSSRAVFFLSLFENEEKNSGEKLN